MKRYKIVQVSPRTQKKTEFSKKLLIALLVISFLFTVMSYALAWFDKNTNETLTITIVQTLWSMDGACFIGYVFQNSARAWSLNKFGKRDISNETSNFNKDDEIYEDNR